MQRCFKTCLPCRPGTRRPRRSAKGADDTQDNEEGSISSPRLLLAQAGGPVLTTPLVELVFQRADPRASVEIYLQVRACPREEEGPSSFGLIRASDRPPWTQSNTTQNKN